MYVNYFSKVGREHIGSKVTAVMKGSGAEITGKLTQTWVEWGLLKIDSHETGEGYSSLIDIEDLAAMKIWGQP